jgi:hypothetical protein
MSKEVNASRRIVLACQVCGLLPTLEGRGDECLAVVPQQQRQQRGNKRGGVDLDLVATSSRCTSEARACQVEASSISVLKRV